MPINNHEDDFTEWLPIWEKIEDAISGQDKIKDEGEKYLPKLGGQSDPEYQAYLKRAQYQNLSGRTMQIALGQLFRKPPIIQGIPDEFIDNIDLAGSNLIYFSKKLAHEIIAYNRVGVLVDYSVEQSRPFIKKFEAESIINWRSQVIDGIKKLVLVVIEGERCVIDPLDPYSEKDEKVWKELYLEDGAYKVRDWEEYTDNTGTKQYRIIEGSENIPLMNGQPLDFIPFYFFTANGISTHISASSMLDFVNINLGHYVNYADYENMLHWTGAKTIVTDGWGDKTFPIGGAVECKASFLEASSDSGLKEELRHKEELMAIMGSQLLSGKGRYVASAQTSQISSEGEYATLADTAMSLSYCMKTALKLMAAWAGENPDDVNIEYNTDYQVADMPQGKLTELMGAYQAGKISWETFFYQLKGYEFYPNHWTIEDEQAAIDKGMAKQIEARDAAINQAVADKMEAGQVQMNNAESQDMPMYDAGANQQQ